MTAIKVLITGERDWTDEKAIERVLMGLPDGSTIVHGACPTGADAIADKIARKLGLKIRRYPADWDGERERTGSAKPAGPKRNAKMIREEHPDKDGVPFHKGFAFTKCLERTRGTKDCVRRAREAGIKVFEIAR